MTPPVDSRPSTARDPGIPAPLDGSSATEGAANGHAREGGAATAPPHPSTLPGERPAAAPHTSAPPHAAVTHAVAAPRPNGKRRRLLLLVPILLVVLGAALTLGYRYWYDSTYFVATDNASVTGDLIQVGSLNAGRIVATRVDLGAHVRQGQELAVVAMPQQVGATTAGTAPKVDITGTTDTLVPVVSPIDGVVAARTGFVGATVAAGQPIYVLVDPRQAWVKANVEEGSVWRVAIGQPVEVYVDALHHRFSGHVEALTPASAATFSLLPSGNVSGNFTKVTQYVPVKIVVDTGGEVLPLGTSVEVKIRVREPGDVFPLPWRP